MSDNGFCAVDESKCSGDGLCALECPMGLFRMESGRPQSVPNAAQACVRCGHCVAVCPKGALSITGIRPEDCLPSRSAPVLDDAQMEMLLRSRRSIRTFENRPVEQSKIKRLIEIARYAPTAGNSQLVSWTVAGDRAQVIPIAEHTAAFLRHLAATYPSAGRYNFAGLADAWDAGKDFISRGAPVLVFAHTPKSHAPGVVDASIALTYMELAASSLGLGPCWAGFIMMAAANWPPLRESLKLPEGHVVHGAMMLGYPKYGYRLMPPRKEPSVSWL